MKLSDKPTAYIIFNARTNSEWDNCDFAILHVNEYWKAELQRRLKCVEPFAENYTLHCISFYDSDIEFYRDNNEIIPDWQELREEKKWSFVSISENELDALSSPENSLECHTMNITWGSLATFSAYGKHTDEQFWTSQFSMKELISILENNN